MHHSCHSAPQLPGLHLPRLADHLRQDPATAGLDLGGRLVGEMKTLSSRAGGARARFMWSLARRGLPDLSAMAADGWTNAGPADKRQSAQVDQALRRYFAELSAAAGMEISQLKCRLDLDDRARSSGRQQTETIAIPQVAGTLRAALQLLLSANDGIVRIQASVDTRVTESNAVGIADGMSRLDHGDPAKPGAWYSASLLALATLPDGHPLILNANQVADASGLPSGFLDGLAATFGGAALQLFRAPVPAALSFRLKVERPSAHEVLAAQASIVTLRSPETGDRLEDGPDDVG